MISKMERGNMLGVVKEEVKKTSRIQVVGPASAQAEVSRLRQVLKLSTVKTSSHRRHPSLKSNIYFKVCISFTLFVVVWLDHEESRH